MFGLGMLSRGRLSLPAAFSPLDVGTPFTWLRSDDVVTGTGGVVTWTDKTGNGRSPTNGTSTQRPALTASNVAANGHPTLDFDGVDDFLQWSGTMNQVLHYFAVLVPVTDGDFVGGAVTQFDGSGVNTMRLYVSNTTKVNVFSGAAQASQDNAAIDTEALTVVEWVADGASSELFVDAVTPAGTANLSDNPGGITLGARAVPDLFAACSWAELIVYSGELTAGDRAKVRAYLASRYGKTL